MSGKQWIYHFSDAEPVGDADSLRRLLGAKGAALREMTQAGFSVPAGFTITAECCQAYFERGGKWPVGLVKQVREALKRLEEDSGCKFGRGARPLLVSVRSGAAVSMPGMMDTILNCGMNKRLAKNFGESDSFWVMYSQFIEMFGKVAGGIDGAVFGDAGDVVGIERVDLCLELYEQHCGEAFEQRPWESLRRCISGVFDSWNNERAVAYRKRNEIEGLEGTAVNVQVMFASEVSGIVFTRDPSGGAVGRMVVEASYGLGEAVVSGDVTPDRFFVDRVTFEVESKRGDESHIVGALGNDISGVDMEGACLSDGRLKELAELALKVEGYYGYPVDLEFGLAGGEFAVLQSRRIRGLEVCEDTEAGRLEEIERLRGLAGDGRKCWVAHSLGETLRFPTPLTWDIVRRFMSGAGGFGLMYQRLGYRPSQRVCDEGFLELICGRIYADPDRMAELFRDQMPLSYDIDALMSDRALVDKVPTKFDVDRVGDGFLAKLPGMLAAMVRCARLIKKARGRVKDVFEGEVLPGYLEYINAERGRDLGVLSDDEVIAELWSRCGRVLDEFGAESLSPGYFGAMALERLLGRLVQLMGREKGTAEALTLTQGLEGDITLEQDEMLVSVAAGGATMDEFIDQFGHRCVGEMELSQSRWREDRSYPEKIVAQLRRGDAARAKDALEENVLRRMEAERGLHRRLERWGGSVFEAEVERDLCEAQELLGYRETGKGYLMMGYELIRGAIEELGRRWGIGGGVYFLQMEELERFAVERAKLEGAIEERRVRWRSLQRLDMGEVVDSNELEGLGLARELESVAEYQGAAISSGVATGAVRVVLDPREVDDLGQGYVLVCPSTDPGWTPLFVHAAALVVDRGGVLSHGAIVARDFGIPAVVYADATRLIADGSTVRVDGNKGRISIVEDE